MCTNRQKIHTRTPEEAKLAYEKSRKNYALYEHNYPFSTVPVTTKEARESGIPHSVVVNYASHFPGINQYKVPEPKSADGFYTIGRDI